MPSVGDTRLLTVYIKTFNAQFLKQKQPQSSRRHCWSFCDKGHSAGTKCTSLSLIVASSEDHIFFSPNAPSSHSPYFFIFNSWPPHPSQATSSVHRSIWSHFLSGALFSVCKFSSLPSNGIRNPCHFTVCSIGSLPSA